MLVIKSAYLVLSTEDGWRRSSVQVLFTPKAFSHSPSAPLK